MSEYVFVFVYVRAHVNYHTHAHIHATHTYEPTLIARGTHHEQGVARVCAQPPRNANVHAPRTIPEYSGKPAGVGHAYSRRNNTPPEGSLLSAATTFLRRFFATNNTPIYHLFSHHGSTWKSREQILRDACGFCLPKTLLIARQTTLIAWTPGATIPLFSLSHGHP